MAKFLAHLVHLIAARAADLLFFRQPVLDLLDGKALRDQFPSRLFPFIGDGLAELFFYVAHLRNHFGFVEQFTLFLDAALVESSVERVSPPIIPELTCCGIPAL